jgi:hypothetical protein
MIDGPGSNYILPFCDQMVNLEHAKQASTTDVNQYVSNAWWSVEAPLFSMIGGPCRLKLHTTFL